MPDLDPNYVLTTCREFELSQHIFREDDEKGELAWITAPDDSGRWVPGTHLSEFIANLTTTVLDLCAFAKEYETHCRDLKFVLTALVQGEYATLAPGNTWFYDIWHANDSGSIWDEIKLIRIEAHIRGRLAWLKRGTVNGSPAEPSDGETNKDNERSDSVTKPLASRDAFRALEIIRTVHPPNVNFSAPDAQQMLNHADPPLPINSPVTMRKILDSLKPHGIASTSGPKRKWYISLTNP